MNEGLAVQENKVSALGEVTITQDQVALIKNTVALGATDDELKLFFFECRRRGVHPLDRLIHFVKRSGKATFQCGIDFMRSQAEASGQYRGQDDVEYGPKVNGYPEWAKATVRRIDPNTGDIYTVSATAYWDEFYPGETLGFMWKKMPRVMLGKVAESQALRKAFPLNFNGLYTFEEMQQADIVASGTPKGEPKQPQSKSDQKDLRQEILHMVHNMVEEDLIDQYLIEKTAWDGKNKDGEVKHFEGKSDLTQISDAAIKVVYGKIKKDYEVWQKGQSNA